MDNCTEKEGTLVWIPLSLSILSVVMCMVAIAVTIYYKFYRSFNYRLILYLLVAFLLKVLITLTLNTLILLPEKDYSYLIYIMLVAIYMTWSSLWIIQLWIAFMTTEIFSMVIFSVELRKAEIPLTIACFTLPLVELVGLHYIEQIDLFITYNAILGMVAAGICAIATAVTLICLAYHGLRSRAINDNEEQHLLHEQTRQRYRNALKESLPFIIYPAMILLWLLMYYVLVYTTCKQVTQALRTTYHIYDVSTGTISSIVFFIHITIIGQRKRNTFRNRAHNIAPSHSNQEINEGQRITVAGSITATHVTDFDPLGDSDVEP